MSQTPCAIPTGTAGRLVEHYKMERIPHEGAWFALRWVSAARGTGGASEARPASSAIVALVTREHFSAMHRLRTDEMWHFYGGSAAELLLLYANGRAEVIRFGGDVFAGEQPQVAVPAGTWMGARPIAEDAEAYSFFGCSLAPGFDYGDYEAGFREELQAGWPAEAALIAALTRADPVRRPAGERAVTARAPAPLLAGVVSGVFGPDDAAEFSPAGGVRVRELAGRTGVARTDAVSLARFRLEAGATTGSSRYFGCDEFFVVLSGTGVATLAGAEAPVRAGSVVAIARGEAHALRADASGPLEFLTVLAPAFNPSHYMPERV